MKQLRLLPVATLVTLAACNDATTTQTTQLNLDRPVDIAFACYGGLRVTTEMEESKIAGTAQPLQSCIIRSTTDEAGNALVPPGQEDRSTTDKVDPVEWYAFILQSGPGTVALAHYGTKPSESFATGTRDVEILDVDPLTPGINGISVGEDPVAIATDKVGCFEVVANAGSCDLSTLEVNSVFTDPTVTRMDVKNAAGEVIRARPAAMAFEPPGGTIGARCTAQPTGLAYIAYPSCHMVAGVDVATGTIVTTLRFDASGVATPGDGNITCPAECDGAAPTTGTRPMALDLERDERTGRIVLAVGADNSDLLTVFDLDLQTMLPLSKVAIPPLEHAPTSKLGLTSVAISPVIGMGGINGSDVGVIDDTAPGGDHQFVYSVATDGTVRVVDISGAPRECDTNVDPRYLADVRDVSLLSCLPAGTPTTPRRPGARGPGIELTSTFEDAIPTSVDIVRAQAKDDRVAGNPGKFIGYIAVVTAANGQVFTVNVDNDDFYDYIPSPNLTDQLKAPIPLDIAHQLRDAVPDRGKLAERSPEGNTMIAKFVCDDPGPDADAQGGTSGGPRITGSISMTVPAGIVATEKTGGLPSIRQVLCHDELKADDPDTAADADKPVSELFFSAPLETRVAEFPDLRALRPNETWTLTYEGSLSNDTANTAVDGPSVRTGQITLDSSGLKLVDQTRPFCEAGVETNDIVQLRGCDPSLGDAGCPIGYTCFVHPQSTVTGIGACMLADEAERLANACKSFLTSMRRYTVGRTKSGELQLLPRKAVLRTTPITGCTSDDQCEQLADYAIQNASSLNPGDPGLTTDSKTWRCQVDPDRKLVLDTSNQPRKRCLAVCDSDTDCGVGTVCQGGTAGSGTKAGYCMEGVVPPQSCVNAPQRYELHAGEAFAVLGSRQGYIHPIKSDNDVCVRDPNAHPLQIGRIPLDAPACVANADPRTGALPGGGFEPNPCKTTVDETEFQLNYVPGTCTLGDPDETVVTRPATAIRFRNRSMQLTIVDPTYQGDLMCHGDRKGTLQDVPLVMPGYQLAFRQTAGFTPYTVPGIQPALPIKALKSPTNDSFWVIDEGDFLSTSLSQASTRGKVIRVESRAINNYDLIE